MYKVALLTNMLPPYRHGIIERLGARPDFDLTVFISRVGEHWGGVDQLPNTTITLVKGRNLKLRQQRKDLNTWIDRDVDLPIGMFTQLIKHKPDVVITLELGLRTLIAVIYCFLFRKPMVLWIGETIHHAKSASRLQRLIRRFLIPQADSYLAYGEATRAFYKTYNVPNEKIHLSVQAVNNELWKSRLAEVNIDEVRAKYNLNTDSGKVVLYVGQLIARKGVDHFLEAWAKLPASLRDSNTLLIVGSGNSEESFKKQTNELSLKTVHFLGRKAPPELADLYAVASLFVMPSLIEIWGLVTNEAMNAGLPVVCSKHAGCAYELITDDAFGTIIDPEDHEEFSNALEHWLSNDVETPVKVIQDHIAHWNYERAEIGFTNAIYQAMKKPVPDKESIS